MGIRDMRTILNHFTYCYKFSPLLKDVLPVVLQVEAEHNYFTRTIQDTQVTTREQTSQQFILIPLHTYLGPERRSPFFQIIEMEE